MKFEFSRSKVAQKDSNEFAAYVYLAVNVTEKHCHCEMLSGSNWGQSIPV